MFPEPQSGPTWPPHLWGPPDPITVGKSVLRTRGRTPRCHLVEPWELRSPPAAAEEVQAWRWASCPKQAWPLGPHPALWGSSTPRSPGQRCRHCRRVEAQVVLPGRSVVVGAPCAHRTPDFAALRVPRIHLLLGTSGTPRGTRGCQLDCPLDRAGRQEGAAPRLSSRVHPGIQNPCFPLTPLLFSWCWTPPEEHCSLDARWVVPPCLAALPVCHLLLLPCRLAHPFVL